MLLPINVIKEVINLYYLYELRRLALEAFGTYKLIKVEGTEEDS